MANEGETNPKNQTAPGSDSQWSGAYNREMVELLRDQLDNQGFQTKYIRELTEKIESLQREEINAKKKQTEAETKGDAVALGVALKQYEEAKASRENTIKELKGFQDEVKATQKQITNALVLIADDSNTKMDLVKRELDASLDVTKELTEAITEAQIREKTLSLEFKTWSKEFIKQSKEEQSQREKERKAEEIAAAKLASEKERDRTEETDAATEDTETEKLAQEVRDAVEQIKGTSGEDSIGKLIERTGASIQSLSIVQQMLSDAMKSAGIDRKKDETAAMVFTAKWAKDKETQTKIVEKLTEMKEAIRKEDIIKSLEEKLIQEGVREEVAQIRAERLAESQFEESIKAQEKQIEIFKNIEEASLLQIAATEKQERQREEQRRESQELPAWYKDLKYRIREIDANIRGMWNEMKNGGWLFRLLAVLALVVGVIVGMVSAAIVRTFGIITSLFKEGGVISRFFSYLRKTFPLIDKVLDGMKSFFTYLKEGTVIGRFFTSTFGAISRTLTTTFAIFKDIGTVFGTIGSALSKFFAPVMKIFEFFMAGFRFGYGIVSGIFKILRPVLTIVSKLFIPLTILLTVIDAVIGAFKGFSKDGISGLIVGVVAGIIDGLTLGLIGFDGIYNFLDGIVKKVTGFFGDLWEYTMMGIDFLWKINPIRIIYESMKWMYNKVVENFDMVVSTLGTIYEKTKEFLGKAVEKTKQLGKAALEVAIKSNPLYWMYRGVVLLQEKLSDIIPDFVEDIIEKVKDIFDDVMKSLDDLLGGLLSYLGIVESKTKSANTNPKATQISQRQMQGAVSLTGFDAPGAGTPLPGPARSLNWWERLTKKLNEQMDIPFSDETVSINELFNPFAIFNRIAKENSERIKKYQEQKELERQQRRENEMRNRGGVPSINTSNVNIASSGSKSQPTIIAPQPHRNTEPTFVRSEMMQHPSGLI